MRTVCISTFAVIAAAALPASAIAAERPPADQPDGIIAILIGQAKAFTPPIGTNHGS